MRRVYYDNKSALIIIGCYDSWSACCILPLIDCDFEASAPVIVRHDCNAFVNQQLYHCSDSNRGMQMGGFYGIDWKMECC